MNENVSACGRNNISAGASKTLEYMKSEDFYKEVKAGGGDYQFEEGNSPILPKPKYSVSFIVTPSDLTNHVIKVNDAEITGNTQELEAGTYTVNSYSRRLQFFFKGDYHYSRYCNPYANNTFHEKVFRRLLCSGTEAGNHNRRGRQDRSYGPWQYLGDHTGRRYAD